MVRRKNNSVWSDSPNVAGVVTVYDCRARVRHHCRRSGCSCPPRKALRKVCWRSWGRGSTRRPYYRAVREKAWLVKLAALVMVVVVGGAHRCKWLDRRPSAGS